MEERLSNQYWTFVMESTYFEVNFTCFIHTQRTLPIESTSSNLSPHSPHSFGGVTPYLKDPLLPLHLKIVFYDKVASAYSSDK